MKAQLALQIQVWILLVLQATKFICVCEMQLNFLHVDTYRKDHIEQNLELFFLLLISTHTHICMIWTKGDNMEDEMGMPNLLRIDSV